MAGKVPAFSASLVTVTGEGQQLNLAATGSTHTELEKNVGLLREIAQAAIQANNARVLQASAKLSETQDEIMGRAVRALCLTMGVDIPPEYARQPNGHDAQGGTQHADPAGAVHAPADS